MLDIPGKILIEIENFTYKIPFNTKIPSYLFFWLMREVCNPDSYLKLDLSPENATACNNNYVFYTRFIYSIFIK